MNNIQNDVAAFYNSLPKLVDKGIRVGFTLLTHLLINRQDNLSPEMKKKLIQSNELKDFNEAATMIAKIASFNIVTVVLVAQVAFFFLGQLRLKSSTIGIFAALALTREVLDMSIISQSAGDSWKGLGASAWKVITRLNHVPIVNSEKRGFFFRNFTTTPSFASLLDTYTRK